MAGPFYVRSTDGGGSDDGLSWANARDTLATGAALLAAGERLYVSQVHDEDQGSAMSIIFSGTKEAPVEIIGVSDAAEPPTALNTGNSVGTTGSFAITLNGSACFTNINFRAGTGAGNGQLLIATTGSGGSRMVFDTCSLEAPGSGGGALVSVGGAASSAEGYSVDFYNCSFDWGANHSMRCGGNGIFRFFNCTFPNAGTAALFRPTLNHGTGTYEFYGCDMSATTGALVEEGNDSDCLFYFNDCRFGSGVAIGNGPGTGNGMGATIIVENSDSTSTTNRYWFSNPRGVSLQDTSVYLADNYAIKATSRAAALFSVPFLAAELSKPVTTTGGALTATVQILTDNVTLKDDEIWLELQYLGNGSYPLASFVSDRKTDLFASAANQATSSETWTGTGGFTSPVEQELSVSFTPQLGGRIVARVWLAKPSQTVWIHPKIEVS